MNFNKLINQLLPSAPSTQEQSSKGGLNGGSLAAGAALGGVAGYLANSATGRQAGRKAMRLGRSAAGLGGLALVGGLAFKAISAMSESSKASAAVVDTTVTNPLFILRSMIAAALADGVLDDQEHERILGHMATSGLSAQEQQFLTRETEQPWTVTQLGAACSTPQMAAELYAAARLAITVDTTAERTFLADLGRELNLEPAIVAEIEGQLAAA